MQIGVVGKAKEEVSQIYNWGTFHILANIFILQALPIIFYDKTVWLSLDIIIRIFAYLCILQIILMGFTYMHREYILYSSSARKNLFRYYISQFVILVCIAIFYYLTESISDIFKVGVQVGMIIYMVVGILGLIFYLLKYATDNTSFFHMLFGK